MSGDHHCTNCSFDFSQLAMSVEYFRSDGRAPALRCPVCGQGGDKLRLRAKDTVFVRVVDGSTRQWARCVPPDKAAGTLQYGGRVEQKAVVIGELRLRTAPGVVILPVTISEVCYSAVPLFASEGAPGGQLAPALPVRSEYIDCLDPDALDRLRRSETSFGQVVQDARGLAVEYTIPLRGYDSRDRPVQRCGVLPPAGTRRDGASKEEMVHRGISIRMWPNLANPYPGWKYYLASAGAVNEHGKTALAGRKISLRLLVPSTEFAGVWERIEGRHAYVRGERNEEHGVVAASIQGRPSWAAVEVGSPDTDTMRDGAGGLFPVKPGSGAPSTQAWEFGIDFGTSNTVVAAKVAGQQQPQCIAPEHVGNRTTTTLYLVNQGPVTEGLGPGVVDLWPGGQWSGPHKDLVPSELAATNESWAQIALNDGQRIPGLVFGVDFGVPLRGVPNGFPADRLIGEFKWQRAVWRSLSSLATSGVTQALQTRFLEATILMAIGQRLADEPAVPSNLSVELSFPLAFTKSDKDILWLALRDAVERVGKLTGIQLLAKDLQKDEAQAAVAAAGTEGEQFRVYLDLGGGSFEILVEDVWASRGQRGHDGLSSYLVSTSIYYGGSVFLRSLVGNNERERRGSCIAPSAAYAQLASGVRRVPQNPQWMDNLGLIPKGRMDAAQRRARAYFGYIVEYAARTLAGILLEHGRHGNSDKAPVDLTRNRCFARQEHANDGRNWVLGNQQGGKAYLSFGVILLGNGWGFAETLLDGRPTVEDAVSSKIQARVRELLRETEVSKSISDGTYSLADERVVVEVKGVPLVSGRHRKSSVALGLVGGGPRGVQGSSNALVERCGVLGFDLYVSDTQRTIPWYRPFGPPVQSALRKKTVTTTPTPPAPVPAPAPVAAPPVVPVTAPVAPAVAPVASPSSNDWISSGLQAAVPPPAPSSEPDWITGMLQSAAPARPPCPDGPADASLRQAAEQLKTAKDRLTQAAAQAGKELKVLVRELLTGRGKQLAGERGKTFEQYVADAAFKEFCNELWNTGIEQAEYNNRKKAEFERVKSVAVAGGKTPGQVYSDEYVGKLVDLVVGVPAASPSGGWEPSW